MCCSASTLRSAHVEQKYNKWSLKHCLFYFCSTCADSIRLCHYDTVWQQFSIINWEKLLMLYVFSTSRFLSDTQDNEFLWGEVPRQSERANAAATIAVCQQQQGRQSVDVIAYRVTDVSVTESINQSVSHRLILTVQLIVRLVTAASISVVTVRLISVTKPTNQSAFWWTGSVRLVTESTRSGRSLGQVSQMAGLDDWHCEWHCVCCHSCQRVSDTCSVMLFVAGCYLWRERRPRALIIALLTLSVCLSVCMCLQQCPDVYINSAIAWMDEARKQLAC